MKKGEQAEISAKWWKDSQPKGLKSAARLDDALRAYEAAKKKLGTDGDAKAADSAAQALDAIEAAAKAVVQEATRIKGNTEIDWTADALKKLDKPVATERKWIADHAGDEEEQGDFASPDAYKAYITAALKHVRSAGQANFAAVLGGKVTEHRIALHKSKAPASLAERLARDTGLHAATFGIAMTPKAAGIAEQEEAETEGEESYADEKPRTLVLALHGRQLPGMQSKLGKMLKSFRSLPFNAVVLMVDGAVVDDIADPDETDNVVPLAQARQQAAEPRPQTDQPPTAGQLRATMEKIAPALKAAMARYPDHRDAMMKAAGDFVTHLRSMDLDQAKASLDQAISLLAATRGTTDPVAGPGKVAYTKLRLDWDTARKQAGNSLKQLEAAVLAAFEGADDYEEMQIRVRKLDIILETMAGDLQDKLDEALQAPDDAKKPIHQEALAIIAEYKDYVDHDPFVTAIEMNPLVPVGVQSGLSKTLGELAAALA